MHELVWQDWLNGTFEAQCADLLAYLSTLRSPLDKTLAVWTYAGMPYKKFEAKVKAAIAKNIDTD